MVEVVLAVLSEVEPVVIFVVVYAVLVDIKMVDVIALISQSFTIIRFYVEASALASKELTDIVCFIDYKPFP